MIEHEHRIEQTNFIAKALGQALDQPNHVIAEITDGPGNERRQTRKANGAKTLHVRAKKRDGIFFFPNDAVTAFQNTGAIGVAKNLLRICSGKRVSGDFFAAFHAFEEKRKARALCDAEIRADRR